MNLNLKGKRALVTGGTHGIGLAICNELINQGVEVITFSRDGPDSNFKGRWMSVDVLDDSYLDRLKDVGNIDILINNVGGGGRWGSDEYEEFNEWNDVYRKNAGIATELTMKFLPHMRNKEWGRVITISSIYGKESGGKPWFVMAKASQIALMKSLSKKGYKGITFNTICPGHIDIGNNPDSKIVGQPEDVANIVTFLCSDKAKHINGACITVDGGESYSY